MKKGLSVLLIAAALFGFYGGAVNLNDVLACKDYWEEEGERSTADMNKLEDGLNQLKDNEQAYLDGLDAVADGEEALAQGEQDYADGQATLAQGEADYAAAPAKLRAGEKKLAAGKAAIAKGESDLGKLNDKYFIYVAAFGAFTEVSYATSQQSKNTIGHLAYLLAGVKSLSTIKGWKLTYRSQEMSGSGDFIYGMVTNSNSVGGFKGITGRDVTLNDGLMEVTLIRMPDLFTEYPLIANALINDVDNKYIVKFKTTRIEFWSSEDIEIPWTTDGEYGGSHKHIVIEDLYRALPIVLGEQPADVIDEEDRREEENYRKPRDENGKVTGN